MKKLDELTEQEILKLTSDDIAQMIKFRMAEEGVKFIDYPKIPVYHEVQNPTTKAYYCNLLGMKLSFVNMDELNSVIELLNSCKTACSIDDNYDLPEGNRNYMKAKLDNASWSVGASDVVTPITAYTHKEYLEIKDKLKENSENKKHFEAKVKEYESAINDSKYLKDEIIDRINEVNEKYDKLNMYIRLFINEYMPLSGNNKKIAMGFLNKAYNLTTEQQDYVLDNYKSNTAN